MQEHGVNYNEIFSPGVKMTTLRLLLSVVATEDIELEQLDVNMAFLHRDLDKRHLHVSSDMLHGNGGARSPRLQAKEELIWPKARVTNMVS